MARMILISHEIGQIMPTCRPLVVIFGAIRVGIGKWDTNLISHGINVAVSRHVSVHSRLSLRGFDRGRNLLERVMDIDTEARAMALVGTEHTHPVMIFWDFLAALPAAAHSVLFEAMECASMAQGAHYLCLAGSSLAYGSWGLRRGVL